MKSLRSSNFRSKVCGSLVGIGLVFPLGTYGALSSVEDSLLVTVGAAGSNYFYGVYHLGYEEEGPIEVMRFDVSLVSLLFRILSVDKWADVFKENQVALFSLNLSGYCDWLSAFPAYGGVTQEIRRGWFRTNGRMEGLVPHNYIRSSGDAVGEKTNLPERFWSP